MKLSAKLLALLVPLVVFPLLLLGWLAYKQLSSDARGTMLREMDTVQSQVGRNVSMHVRTARSNAKLFSESGLLKDFVFADKTERYRFILMPLLKLFAGYNRAYPEYYEIRVLSVDGFEEARFSTQASSFNVTENEAGSPLFEAIQKMPGERLTRYQVNPDNGQWSLVVAQQLNFVDPTLEDSTIAEPSLRGYLVLTVALNEFQQQMTANRIGRTGRIFFTSHAGNLLFPESTSLGIKSLSRENLRLLETALEDKSSTTELNLNGQLFIAQIRSLEGGLLLVSILPKEELTQAGRALGMNVLVIAVFAILITVACKLLILTSIITNPLKRLGTGAERIQAGDLDVAIQLKGRDELTDLGQQFNAMAHSLKESWRLRDQAQAEALKNKELAIANLKKADQLKDEFLANTSHELRTPLHGMTGIAESLLKGAAGPLNENVVTNLKLIVAGGKRLSHLVNDILDFSKLRHGELKLNLQSVDIQSICRLVLTTLQPTMATRDISLKMDIPDHLPLVLVDENRLQQIFYNLVGNAIKFTESGEVAINASIKGDQIEIAVSDTGKGIPEDKLESIFDSFLQLDSAADRTQGGTGLGLTITRKLVQYHGGDIWVRSKVGRGTTVFFTMPVATGSVEPDSNVHVESAAGAAASPLVLDSQLVDILPDENLCQVDGDGKIVWVVDDEPMNQQVVENHLSPCGFSVRKASGGREVLEMLNAPAQRPDLVLLDVMMPRMNGFEVCEHIRKVYSPSELPVIFLTARNRPEDIVYGVRAGANDYIQKPFSRDEIIARMKIHLDLADSNRQLRQWTETLEDRVKERTGLLEQANRELEKQNEILKDNQDLREEIEHITQHDLRTPVSGIISLAELILENDSEGPVSTELKMIIESGYLALDVIGRSLSMLKLERGVYELKRDEFNLIALVYQVIRDTASLQKFKGVGVRVFLDGSRVKEKASFRIKAEKGLLYSVFSNLIGNALEATKEAEDVEVAIESSDSNTEICIHNSGVVPDEIRDRFFEKYATAGKPDGNGLGTYSARLIVECHGGSISFTSSKKAGTHLKIVLPNPD